jgi:hypothetical protein
LIFKRVIAAAKSVAAILLFLEKGRKFVVIQKEENGRSRSTHGPRCRYEKI